MASATEQGPAATEQHVVVLQHGNHGQAGDWLPLERALAALHPGGDVIFLRPCTSAGMRTHDGIVRCAERLLEELRPVVADALARPGGEAVTLLLSLVGHSLGGLIVRCAAKLIADLRDCELALVERGGRVQLNLLACCNSPHLGSRRPPGGASWARAAWRRAVHTYLLQLNGQTGLELALADPAALLLQMGTAGHGYLVGLGRFRSRLLVGLV
jgi:pimeloyl-ACP methyl ester carboxylesterase